MSQPKEVHSYNNLANSDLRTNVIETLSPHTEEELIQQLKHHLKQDQKVIFRPFGGKHSWAPTVLSESDPPVVLINTSHLGAAKQDFIPIKLESKESINSYLIPCPPSFTQQDLANYAKSRNPALSVCPTGAVGQSIRLGGFLNSGCHGASVKLPPVSDLVMAVKIITISNTVQPLLFVDTKQLTGEQISQIQQISSDIRIIQSLDDFLSVDSTFKEYCAENFPDATLMDFVRVNFGNLGIVTEFWIRSELQFMVDAVDALYPVNEVINDKFVDNFINKQDHLELFYTPFNSLSRKVSLKHFPYLYVPELGQIQVKYANRVSGEENKLSTENVNLFHSNMINALKYGVKGDKQNNDKSKENKDKLKQNNDDTPKENNDDTPKDDNEKEQLTSPNSIELKESEFVVKLSTEFLNGVINHIHPRITPLFLELFSKASYGHDLSNGSLCSFPISCGKVLLENKPAYMRKQYFNDFSLYEQNVISDLVDVEMEIPLNLDIDPQAKLFQAIWYKTIDLISNYAKNGEYPCNIMLHCRFNGSSRSIMSCLYSPDTRMSFATLECICAYDPKASKTYLNSLGRFMKQVLHLWKDMSLEWKYSDDQKSDTRHPRPHFAKSWFKLPDGSAIDANEAEDKKFQQYVADLFKSNITAFQKFRQQIDPGSHFYGGLVKRLEALVENNNSK